MGDSSVPKDRDLDRHIPGDALRLRPVHTTHSSCAASHGFGRLRLCAGLAHQSVTEADDCPARSGVGQAEAQPIRFSLDYTPRLAQGRSVNSLRQVHSDSNCLKACDFAGELEVHGGGRGTGDTVKPPLDRTSIVAIEK